MSRYLVTGATGFLGAHLVRTLEGQGHDVVALCRGDASSLANTKATIRRGDVLDGGSVRDAAAGCDGAFHCAGLVSRKPEDAELLYRVHVDGTKTALGACRDAKVRRVVVASTSGTIAVGEDRELVANEDHTPDVALISRWPYYRAKLFAERAALAMNDASFEVVSVNPSLLLGPGDARGSSTEDVRLFLERKLPAVPPGGASFVDARDAAEAMRLAMDRGTPGSRYLVAACNLTIRELFARLERISGVAAPWLPVPRAPDLARAGADLAERVMGRLGLSLPVDRVSLDMAQYFWYADATRAETELGWSSRDPIDTLRDTVDDLRARGVVWPEHAEPKP